MSRIKLFLLVWIFMLDVRVKADGHAKHSEHAKPKVHAKQDEHQKKSETCWGKELPCPIQANHGRQTIEAEGLRIALAPKSLLEQRDGRTVQLVTGEFYVETSARLIFKTPYARIWCDDECKAIFVRTVDKIEVKSIEGGWVIQRNGEASPYTVAAGLQLSVSEVAVDGKATMEFPQSLPWSPTLKQIAALYPGTIDELKPTLVKFRETWSEAVEKVSDMHFKAASRAIASYEDGQAKERARKAAQEREDQRLRDLFREKNP